MPAFMQDHIDRATALAKEALGEEPFASAWATGRANPDLVIADALGEREARTTVTGQRMDAAARGLTARERDVLRLLVAGNADKEIAAALGISPRTVSAHVATIRGKLHASSRTAAATIAVRDGLV
jgi:RNA polymerase sigma factor (sigma-70 family)